MKKITLLFMMFLLAALALTGCGLGKDKGTAYQVYYLNIEGTAMQAQKVTLGSDINGEDQLVETLLGVLAEEPENAKLRRTLSEDIHNPQVTFYGSYISLNFPAAYADLSSTDEILIRSAVVLTLTQIEGIDSVEFQVDGTPLRYKTGTLIGRMSADNFLQNPGEQINASLEDTVTLYFSDASGNSLVREERTIHYSSNESLEKTIVKLLVDGPQITDARQTLPSGTNIINVTVADGICYVNLDDTFRNNQDADISEEVVLYSIVDSLTELSSVNKVQISVNGDNNGKVRYLYSLDKMYERNLTLLEEDSSDSTEADGTGSAGAGTDDSGSAGGGNK